MPPLIILRNRQLLDLLAKYREETAYVRDAAIAIERRWSTAGLGDLEILEALARVYGLLSDIVLDGHVHLKQSKCIPVEHAHPDFRSTHHRTGTLECMAAGPEKRTEVFKFSTGEELGSAETTVSYQHFELMGAAERYGLDDTNQVTAWEKLDPIRFADKVLYIAKRMLSRDKYHQRMMFIRDGKGEWHIKVLLAKDRTEKHFLMRSVAQFVESKSCDAIIEVGEAWIAPAKSVPDLDASKIADAKGRREVLLVTVITRDGILRSYMTPFTRGPLGGIKFEDTNQSDDKFAFYYFEPIFDVWRRQRSIRLPDGRERFRVWEPDSLDICFCGGPKRFGECCRGQLPLKASPREIRNMLKEPCNADEFQRAENLARAALAQYVIWVKQHTAVTMHVAEDLYQQLVNIDVLALESHVDMLEECLEANNHGEMFVPQLRHLATTIGVPKLSMRLVALAGRWLMKNGKIEEAILELDSLGDLENIDVTKLEDTLALLMIADICDLSIERKEQMLRRALDVAASEEETWQVKLELVKHMWGLGKGGEALIMLDSVIEESSKSGGSGELYEALLLRWRITKTDKDFQAFNAAIESDSRVSRRRYAAALIDEGLYLEAEKLLLDEINKGDLVAKLLGVDARLRGGSIDSARDLFLTIEQDQIEQQLRYFHAVIAAQLALCCNDEKIRRLAVKSIHNLPLSQQQDEYLRKLLLKVESLEFTNSRHLSDM